MACEDISWTYALGVIDDVSVVLAGDAVEQWLVNQVGIGRLSSHSTSTTCPGLKLTTVPS